MIPFTTRSRGAIFAAGIAALTALSGCATDGYYGGVDVGMGSGYYGGPGYYPGGGYDPYYGGPGYGYGGFGGYGGWYNDFYYPGGGYYVYDRRGARHRWTNSQRAYWEQRRREWRDRNPGRGDGPGGGGWNGRPPGGRPDAGRPGDGRPGGNWQNGRPPRPDGAPGGWTGRPRPDGAGAPPSAGTDGRSHYRRLPSDAQREAWQARGGRVPGAVTPQATPQGARPQARPEGGFRAPMQRGPRGGGMSRNRQQQN